MTPDQKTAVQSYVDQLKDLMALKDWKVRVCDDFCEDDNDAVIQPTTGRKDAAIFLHRNFFSEPPETQRHTLTHELVHCHLHPISTLVREDIAGSFGGDAHQIVMNTYRDRTEYAVDGIADGWAPFLPLPEFGVKEEAE